MQERQLRETLANLPLADILYFDALDSTNERGLQLAAAGAAEYTLLVAKSQTAGRGRFARKWVTQPGASLAFSLILHPYPQERQHMSLFSPLGALAVCAAVADTCNIPTAVKWPNDVLLDGKKTAGVLAETAWDGDTCKGLVLGIGVNLLPISVPPATDVLFPATCVQSHCDSLIQADLFLKSIFSHLIQLRPLISTGEFIQKYQHHLSYLGEQITLTGTAGEAISGEMLGITLKGELRLQLADGKEAIFAAGDVSLRPT